MSANVKILSCVCLLLIAVLLPAKSHAHRVNIFCWAKGQKIFCESSFPGGSVVKEGKIKVLTQNGEELLSGQTDARGKFSFIIPEGCTSDLKIVVQAGMGHKNSWPVQTSEYLPSHSSEGSEVKKEPDKDQTEQSGNRDQREQALDSAEVKEALKEVLARELAPLKKQLAELRQDRVTLQDVIAGLGYILGLMGVALYFKSPKN